MDMSKYKSLFLSEVKDHLDAMEGDLIQLEQKTADASLIHEVFRHVHSIKGMAGSMDVPEMTRLAHHLEDLMAPHRDQGTPVSGEEVTLLLTGLDELRSQLKAAAEDRKPPAASAQLLGAIEKIVGKSPKRSKGAAFSKVKTARSEAAKDKPIDIPKPVGAPSGKQESSQTRQYVVEATLSADCSLPSVRAYLVHKRLSGCSQIEKTMPPLEDVRAGSLPDRKFVLWVRSDSGQEEIQRVLQTIPELEAIEIKPGTDLQQAENADPTQLSAAALASPAPSPLSISTVRVQAELLDFFVDSVGELITQRSHLEELAEGLDVPSLREGVRRLAAVIRRLHDRVMEVRMVPVSQLTQRLPRVCRDVAQSRDKQVRFIVEGEEVQLDRAVVEALDTPVIHLLRNAVDHGIESPQTRAQAGKAEEGLIKLSVRRQQDRVLLTLADDGAGIDPGKVWAKAKAMDLIASGSESLDEAARMAKAIDFLFLPGFSTNEQVSDVSGRGVGLDVVRSTLERMGGRVAVQSELGKGTQFILDFPLTLAILHVLLLETGGHLLALPALRVIRAQAFRSEALPPEGSGGGLLLGRQTLPFAHLHTLLGIQRPQTQAKGNEVVVIGENDKPALALGVDRVAGHREVVIKNLGRTLRSLGPYSSSCVLGDGRPVLVLDADGLLGLAARQPRKD